MSCYVANYLGRDVLQMILVMFRIWNGWHETYSSKSWTSNSFFIFWIFMRDIERETHWNSICWCWVAYEEILFVFYVHSGIKGQLCVPLLYRQGWFRQGMASREKKSQEVLRDEGDEQGENYNKAQCQVCHQRKANSGTAEEPLHRQHVLRILGPREPISGHGLLIRRRPALPYLPSQALLRRNHS